MMIVTEMVLPAIGEPETLQIRQRELPLPAAGEVIIRIEATGVSFAEQSMRRGRYPGQPAFPLVPGYDMVGTVEVLGANVVDVTVGQRVAAVTKTGAWADYIVLPANELIPVPDGLAADAAETAVVNGITAWQMFHDLAHVRAGQTILVHGASGGVGGLLVQLARDAGVRVIGTVSSSKLEALRALGAEPIDYRSADIAAQVHALAPDGVDAVFDHLGGESLHTSWQMLARGGTLVSYGLATLLDSKVSMIGAFIPHLLQIFLWNILPNNRHAYFYNLWGSKTLRPRKFQRELRASLTHVFDLLAQGRIQAQIACRLPIKRAAEALRLAESGKVSGKVVLVPDLD